MASVSDVLARWAYSEIVHGTASAFYNNAPGIEALRQKRREGIAFDQLTYTERSQLAHACGGVRPALLVYLRGIEEFEVAEINRQALGNLIVPPNVWRDSQSRFYPFSHYITTETEEDGDARRLGPPPNGYLMPPDPLTIGRINGHLVLVDGYHRAALFWRFGPAEGTLLAYLPQR